MGWSKFDDGMPLHPKIVALSVYAKLTYTFSIMYASRYHTDGVIGDGAARMIMAWVPVAQRNYNKVAAELQTVGVWKRVDEGYVIHDYLDYNPSSEQIRQERENTARRVAEWKRRHAVSNGAGNGVTNGVRNGVSTPAPSRTRPVSDSLSPKGNLQPQRESNRGKGASAPVPSPLPEHTKDPIWDALCEALGTQPKTPSEKNDCGRTVKELKAAAATPDEIRVRIARMLKANQRIFVHFRYVREHWSEYAEERHEGQHDHDQLQTRLSPQRPQRRGSDTYQRDNGRSYPEVGRISDEEALRVNSRLRPLPPLDNDESGEPQAG